MKSFQRTLSRGLNLCQRLRPTTVRHLYFALGWMLTLNASLAWGEDDPQLAGRLQPLINSHAGDVAVAVLNLETGAEYHHRADEPMPTASLIKLAVMAATYDAVANAKCDLESTIELRTEDKVPGSGILTSHFSAGATFSLRDAVHLMIAYSDNTATNLVAQHIGLSSTAEFAARLGMPNTKLHSLVFKRETSIFPDRSQQYGLGSTTANETVALLKMLHRGELVSSSVCNEMLAHLRACEDRSKLARLLPAEATIAHKTGDVSATRCDAGIITGPKSSFAICVLTTNNEDRRYADDNAAHLLMGQLALATYEHFNRTESATAEEPTTSTLAIGAGGKLVESLQRTLNARLQPSPELGIDGDFGPATQAAVKQFQVTAGMDATGVVDSATWQALGALIERDEPVPSPEEVNSQQPERMAADSITGPPFVTCKAWVIADGETGEIIAGSDDDQSLDIASTTKLMTAYVIADYAEAHPEVWNEIVEFSPHADATPGSTAGLREGERISVGELMYGLLLPSGNDASVALAEHFGERLTIGEEGVFQGTAEDRFIAAMNFTAKELGLAQSTFRNPHGLTAEGHKASARDLGLLAAKLRRFPRIIEIMNTRQHGSEVQGPEGYLRNVIWKNTNQLLEFEGYTGMKTGTTSAAGACLVACGEFEGRPLIVVILGSTSSASRYIDARNLFRWARDM